MYAMFIINSCLGHTYTCIIPKTLAHSHCQRRNKYGSGTNSTSNTRAIGVQYIFAVLVLVAFSEQRVSIFNLPDELVLVGLAEL